MILRLSSDIDVIVVVWFCQKEALKALTVLGYEFTLGSANNEFSYNEHLLTTSSVTTNTRFLPNIFSQKGTLLMDTNVR